MVKLLFYLVLYGLGCITGFFVAGFLVVNNIGSFMRTYRKIKGK